MHQLFVQELRTVRKYLKATGKKGRLEELRMLPVILALITSISLGKLQIFWRKINFTFVSETSYKLTTNSSTFFNEPQ